MNAIVSIFQNTMILPYPFPREIFTAMTILLEKLSTKSMTYKKFLEVISLKSELTTFLRRNDCAFEITSCITSYKNYSKISNELKNIELHKNKYEKLLNEKFQKEENDFTMEILHNIKEIAKNNINLIKFKSKNYNVDVEVKNLRIC